MLGLTSSWCHCDVNKHPYSQKLDCDWNRVSADGLTFLMLDKFKPLVAVSHFMSRFSDSYSSVSLTVSPDRVQHFSDDMSLLTCEGNSWDWRLWMFSEDEVRLFECRSQERIPRVTWSLAGLSSGVFWCESGSEFSNAVNITTGCNFSLNLFTLCMFPTSHNVI